MTQYEEPQSSPLGGTLGGKSARLVSEAVAYTANRLGPYKAAVAGKVFADATNHVSDEIRDMVGPLWREFAKDPETPDHLRPLFHALGNQRGQAMAWIGGTLIGGSVGNALVEVMSNMIQPLVDRILSGDPNQHLSAEAASQAVARGIWNPETARKEALKSGINTDRFSALAQLATSPLAPDAALTLLRRGDISKERATGALRSTGMNASDVEAFLKLRTVPLTPETVAAMWNRSIVNTDQGAAIAADSGVSKEDFVRLTELYGEPLPLGDLQEALRRGFITQAQFARGWAQGPIRNEWREIAEKLQYRRMLPEAAADAINQGHMDLDVGKRIAREHGLDPGDFETIIETAGQPPGIELMEEARNRGIISEALWEQTFKESRIKNIYIDVLRKMRTRLIPTETARLMYREGVYTEDELMSTLKGHGFSDRDAQAQADLEVARRSEGTKELSRAQLVDLYEDDLIDQTMLETGLRDLGYGPTLVDWQVALAEVGKVRRFVNAAVNRVKASYIAGRIDLSEASNLLDELGIGPMQRDRLTNIWDVERETVSAQLTTAQIQWAMRQGMLNDQEAFQRFIGRGYAPEDAAILVAQGGGTPPAAS